ncbi:hypothetical protein WN48_03723 [Eufriesea mexicana]|nr:hypothetical protein WN48_03723 [Eufriesea mexicana]
MRPCAMAGCTNFLLLKAKFTFRAPRQGKTRILRNGFLQPAIIRDTGSRTRYFLHTDVSLMEEKKEYEYRQRRDKQEFRA